ncbi:MAG TPA: hypothetical protein VF140_04175, partial [Phycicoccus sp.]
MERVNVAWTTPATGLIAADSTDDCKFCATTEQKAVWLSQNRARYADAPVSVLAVEALSGAPTGQMYLGATLRQNAADVVDDKGRVIDRDGRKQLERNIALKWMDG